MGPEKGIEKFFGAVRTELHSMGLGEGSAIPGPAEGTGRSTTSAKSFSYAKTPVAGPRFQSALKVACSYL